MKIKAAVLRAINEPFQIEELELAPPKENEVLVRTVASGICHSDYSVAHGILRAPLPVVLGHEGAGVVEAVGPGVSRSAICPSVNTCILWTHDTSCTVHSSESGTLSPCHPA